jgi:NADH-quinone oxidoreductase subunit F
VEKNGGPKLYGLSGPINKPGVYEAPAGITVRELLENYGGGMKEGSELKAFIPGGSSCSVLKPDALDAPMSIEGMREYGSTMGTGCVTFLDQNTCMVRLAARLAHFYHHESCGQCTPCREGSGWSSKVLDAIENGRGRPEDLGLLLDMCDNIQGNTICALGDALAIPVRSYIQVFTEEFEEHIEKGCCSFPSWGKPRASAKNVA